VLVSRLELPRNKEEMNYKHWIRVDLLAIIFVLLLSSCGGAEGSKPNEVASSKEGKKPLIVTTTGMVGDMVSEIVGDKAEVISLMGPGVDPHYYKASQGDLKKIRNADMVFYNGIFLEGKMEGILEKLAKSKPVYAVSEKMGDAELIKMTGEGVEAQYDPHIWHDTKLWASSIPNVASRLGELNPKLAEDFAKSGQRLQDKYMKLHAETKRKISEIPQESRIMVTSHDAFSYFAKAYDIEVAALQGISTVTEFGLKDVTDLVDLIVSRKIKAVFAESSVDPKHLQAVVEGCKKKKHAVEVKGPLLSDALGEAGTPNGTYEGMIRHNVNFLAEALK